MERKYNYFLSPTGYLKHTGLFWRKSSNRRRIKFQAIHTRVTYPTVESCQLPNADSLLLLPSAGAAGAALGNFEGKMSQDKWPQQLLGLDVNGQP